MSDMQSSGRRHPIALTVLTGRHRPGGHSYEHEDVHRALPEIPVEDMFIALGHAQPAEVSGPSPAAKGWRGALRLWWDQRSSRFA